ncbi:CobW family GTP-binding protein [Rhizosphaericola mali]|uniref:GTP-binding protein n=1 Tax=Rhizosphaericola mali TaxID=2545455 RepID=A0A5P2G0G1_9BACT|nr:GTP-binding protein [Rhizosphaericola mali]QES87322.1 GTP-binding protein [Rhizosphaericola mali]
MENNNQAKPVTILTGFLGAGKTTFLNALIKSDTTKRPIIVENEFGEENIDSELVIGAGDKIFSFSDGCVCCSLNNELFELLRQMWSNRDKFDEMIIEATGIADPGFIAMPFMEDPNMENFYKLDRVICLVDAQFIESELENTEEARKQIAFSDILLITKTDLVDADKLHQIKHILKDINPWATVLEGNNKDGYPIDKIRQLTRENIDNAIMEDTQNQYEAEIEEEHHHDHDHEHHHHDHHDHAHEGHHHEHGEHCEHHSHHHGIESFSVKYDGVFDLEKLQDALIDILNDNDNLVYRVKGFVHVKDIPNRLVVQLVGTLLTITDGQAWKENEEKISRLVFIGKGINEEQVEKAIRDCQTKVVEKV